MALQAPPTYRILPSRLRLLNNLTVGSESPRNSSWDGESDDLGCPRETTGGERTASYLIAHPPSTTPAEIASLRARPEQEWVGRPPRYHVCE